MNSCSKKLQLIKRVTIDQNSLHPYFPSQPNSLWGHSHHTLTQSVSKLKFEQFHQKVSVDQNELQFIEKRETINCDFIFEHFFDHSRCDWFYPIVKLVLICKYSEIFTVCIFSCWILQIDHLYIFFVTWNTQTILPHLR